MESGGREIKKNKKLHPAFYIESFHVDWFSSELDSTTHPSRDTLSGSEMFSEVVKLLYKEDLRLAETP